jgi:hypothetical protein
MLLALGYQAWTVPARGDETDANVVSVERFRHHAWWVGGNALSYRPVLAVAIMHRSPAMMEVLQQVASKALSATSFATTDTSFWCEGMTEDGAGWGHGRQNQVFAYPRDGTASALDMLEELKGMPWDHPLERQQLDCLLNYIRGSSWFYYKGYLPPVLYRANMVYGHLGPASVPTQGIVTKLLKGWSSQLTTGEIAELKSYSSSVGEAGTSTPSTPSDDYRGVRYFWNQDTLVAKSDTHYMLVSMCSTRSDGLESTKSPATAWNFFTDDGQTLFCRDGSEYTEAIGAWNLTAVPGVTARQGEEYLQSVTNWHGYHSTHNFAGGVTRGADGCAGFIFEKSNFAKTEQDNDPNKILYGVQAYKAYFVMGDTMMVLGAGIDNLQPDLPGDVWTTINQTSWRTKVSARDARGREHDASAPNGQSFESQLLSDGDRTAASVRHDGFTYVILPKWTTGQVKLSLSRRPTKWNKLANDNKKLKTPAEADIFQLWIDHGSHPTNASYAYLVSAGDVKPDALPMQVIENSKSAQAVSSADGTCLQAIFYSKDANVSFGDRRIAVSAPCVLMLQQRGDKWIVTASDPEQDASKTEVAVRIGSRGKVRTLAIPLPSAPLLGKPITLEVNAGH